MPQISRGDRDFVAGRLPALEKKRLDEVWPQRGYKSRSDFVVDAILRALDDDSFASSRVQTIFDLDDTEHQKTA